MKVGIIGCGTIGSALAEFILKDLKEKILLIGICDLDRSKIETLSKRLNLSIEFLEEDDIIKSSDLVVEAASVKSAESVVQKAVAASKDLLVMSSGVFLKDPDLFNRVQESSIDLYLPSGAICGIDSVKAAMCGRIDSAILTSRKPVAALKDANFVVKANTNIDDITEEKMIFEGNAADAIRFFPKNINVSATLYLAGIKNMVVRIIASPFIKNNIHEIEIIGDFGKIAITAENVPAPYNPKTSFLAVLSAMATLKQIVSSTHIGT